MQKEKEFKGRKKQEKRDKSAEGKMNEKIKKIEKEQFPTFFGTDID